MTWTGVRSHCLVACGIWRVPDYLATAPVPAAPPPDWRDLIRRWPVGTDLDNLSPEERNRLLDDDPEWDERSAGQPHLYRGGCAGYSASPSPVPTTDRPCEPASWSAGCTRCDTGTNSSPHDAQCRCWSRVALALATSRSSFALVRHPSCRIIGTLSRPRPNGNEPLVRVPRGARKGWPGCVQPRPRPTYGRGRYT
jgi:hypothetical protein